MSAGRAGRKAAASVIPLRRRDEPRRKKGDIAFRTIRGDLFINDPQPSDARQGKIGDCYFLCALSALARSCPQTLKRMITRRRDGTCKVRFFRRLDGGGYASESVVVDGRLPVVRDGTLVYTRTRPDVQGRVELWPMIAEKAYARWKGGYHVIGEGGAVEEVLEELTGQPSRVFYVAKNDPEVLWKVLREATVKNWPTAVCSYGRVAKPEIDEFGFHPWHIHVFLGVHVWNGRRIVWLRDPYDRPPAGSVNLPDPNGVLTLSWEHFLHYFAEIIVNGKEALRIPATPYPRVTLMQSLKRSYIFSVIPHSCQKGLAQSCRRVDYKEGEQVFASGSEPDYFYLIRSGSAGAFLHTPGRRPTLLGVLEAGDQFGDVALINHTVRRADVKALSPLSLYRMPARKFWDWIRKHPEMLDRFRRRFEFQVWMQKRSKLQVTSVSLDALLKSGQEEFYRSGSIIFRQGDPARCFYLILQGRVKMHVKGNRGRWTKVLGEGAIFGETAASSGRSRGATTRASGSCRLLRIDMDSAASVVENFEALQRQLRFISKLRVRKRKG